MFPYKIQEISLDELNSKRSHSEMSKDFESLCTKWQCCDATLNVGQDGRKFKAHKLILSARSLVFKAMLGNPSTRESLENCLNIADIYDEEAFEQFLRYIYTGRVEQMDEHLVELMKFANKVYWCEEYSGLFML